MAPFSVSTILILCFLVASGFLIGYTHSSAFWVIIPILLGAFLGCWRSQFGKALTSKNISPVLREKLMDTIRTLSYMWIFISICFVFMGYGLTYFVK